MVVHFSVSVRMRTKWGRRSRIPQGEFVCFCRAGPVSENRRAGAQTQLVVEALAQGSETSWAWPRVTP